MEGLVRDKMVEGVENTESMVVFITEAYQNKVNGPDMKDNCKVHIIIRNCLHRFILRIVYRTQKYNLS